MPKTFEPDFYVVCATVIPVLFLAVAVQGNAYKSLLDNSLKARITKVDDSWVHKLKARLRGWMLRQLGYYIWCAGALGETLALWVLYKDQEQGSDRQIVLWATIFLVFAVAMGPLNAYIEVRRKADRWDDSRREIKQSDNVLEDNSATANSSNGGKLTSGGRLVAKVDHPTSKKSGLGWPDES